MLEHICENCQFFQQEEPDAGLLSGCVCDALYEDEECQVINEKVNNKIIEYMRENGFTCPYYKEVKSI